MSELLELLADERRRYVLYYLQDRENAELEEVTEQVAAWETETPPEELDEKTVRNVRTSLYHGHLPKLEEAGIIGYDPRHGSMYLQCLPAPIEQILAYCSDVDSPETNRR